jgi:hypothetical protein
MQQVRLFEGLSLQIFVTLVSQYIYPVHGFRCNLYFERSLV